MGNGLDNPADVGGRCLRRGRVGHVNNHGDGYTNSHGDGHTRNHRDGHASSHRDGYADP